MKTKTVVTKFDRNGNRTGPSTIHPDFRSGLDEAQRHVGELGASDRRKAREALEEQSGSLKRDITLRGADIKTARVHEAVEHDS